MHATKLICPQAQPWSGAIFYFDNLSLLISELSADGRVFLEVVRILRHDEVMITIDKFFAIKILKLIAIT